MILFRGGSRAFFEICFFQFRELVIVFFILLWFMVHSITGVNDEGFAEGCQKSWNLSVVLISWQPPAVCVRWHFNPKNITIARFEVTYRPLNAWYRVVHDIPGDEKSVILEQLQPGAEYQLHVVAFDLSGNPTNISNKLLFISPDVMQKDNWSQKTILDDEVTTPFRVREEEVVIVVLVLSVWVFVMVLFFKKWGKIRMLESYQPQYHAQSVIAKPSRQPLNDVLAPLERFNLEFGATSTPYHTNRMRSRQNSVFVGSPYRSRSGSVMSEPRTPRKVKSAEDIKSLSIQIEGLQQTTPL
ncbi:uncharacterized protein [Parasteatoda tepidariorum]|uniref:uncharacterized protein n=1 Tax=Parasteatoda tepidariorum TaxID=114398 RepID=UPI001C726437|nr:uncharacterized protein LOC107442942 [Parasteatoda tepidariorum]